MRRPSPETAATASKEDGLYMICHPVETCGRAAKAIARCADCSIGAGRSPKGHRRNVFLGIGGALHTPKPDCFLEGITRRTVIDSPAKSGIKVARTRIMQEELEQGGRVFHRRHRCGSEHPVGEIGPRIISRSDARPASLWLITARW